MVKKISNWINNKEKNTKRNEFFSKVNPANGNQLFLVARSKNEDVEKAIDSALKAHKPWANTPAVQRGLILHSIVLEMIDNKEELSKIIHLETGKSIKEALGEINAAIECGIFYSSEGQRLYAKTTTSGVENKFSSTIRQPVGIAGLIIAANTPIANIAWKVFPALICGNTAILKSSEDAPATSLFFGKLANKAGLPDGVLNIIQGYGEEAGMPIVENENVGVISFTGSTNVGRQIQLKADSRLAKVSLELGGKNPLVVCDDADIEKAVHWSVLSAFSNAGQRCASGSRIIIFESVYNKFVELFVNKTNNLKIGCLDRDDLGPVINEKQIINMLKSIKKAQRDGARILAGGQRLTDKSHAGGFFLEPTIIDNVDNKFEISQKELFGPITCLYKVKNYSEALNLANDSIYGLTGSIHTKDFDRANHFIQNLEAGVVVVNAGTFGSEPHMPFGGIKQSGNGTREPGTEALDVYSNLKDVYINISKNII